MSFDKQLECSQIVLQFDSSCLGSINLPGRLMFACRGRQQPTLWSISFAKVTFMHIMKQW